MCLCVTKFTIIRLLFRCMGSIAPRKIHFAITVLILLLFLAPTPASFSLHMGSVPVMRPDGYSLLTLFPMTYKLIRRCLYIYLIFTFQDQAQKCRRPFFLPPTIYSPILLPVMKEWRLRSLFSLMTGVKNLFGRHIKGPNKKCGISL